jgi:hypothetical protein
VFTRITETDCVYCAVLTEYLYVIPVNRVSKMLNYTDFVIP